jgi:hypothetical protein
MELLHRKHVRSSAQYGCHRGAIHTDDSYGSGSLQYALSKLAAIRADTDAVVCPDSINTLKDVLTQLGELVGYSIDTRRLDHFLIGISEKRFSKVFHALLSPSSPFNPVKVGSKVFITDVQSLSSNMIDLANLFPSLLPFSRGFSSLMLGTHHNQVRVSLSEHAFADLWLWHISFCHAANDCLFPPISLTPSSTP